MDAIKFGSFVASVRKEKNMNPAMILRTVFEFAMFAAVLWGIFHEDRLVAFEKRIACLIRRRRLRVGKTSGVRKASF